MKTVTIARLRSNVTYTKPLETVLDSFFELLVNWMKTRTDLQFKTYNVSFGDGRPKRTPAESDYWVIPSDSEFRYHGDLQMNPKDLAKSQSHIEELLPFIEGKHVIMFRSDRGDTEELYRNGTFKGINLASFTTIDEIDFPGNIHGMKYHFISKLHNPIMDMFGNQTDLVYWGRMKHDENDRSKFIKKVYRDPDLSQVLIGGFPSGVKRDHKWIKKWSELFPLLKSGRCTVCFNWKDMTATTSRYVEALAVGLIPFVWCEYDKNNTYNIDPWQRVNSFEEFKDKCLELRSGYDDRLEQYRKNYESILLRPAGYQKIFNEKMNKGVNL